MDNLIIILIVAAVVGLTVFYIRREKKKGSKCIGCPDSATCPSAKNGGCSCGSNDK